MFTQITIQVSKHFNLPLKMEQSHPEMTFITEYIDHPLKVVCESISKSMNTIGQVLSCLGYTSLGHFIMNQLPQQASLFIECLVKTFDFLDEVCLVNGTCIPTTHK